MTKEFNASEKFNGKRHKKGNLGFALTLVAAGLVFLFVNVGIIPTEYKSLLTAWPIWLILAGIISLYHKNWGTTAVLFTIGIFFLIPYLSPIHPELNIPSNFTSLYWPVLLIIGGLLIALERIFKKNDFFYTNFAGTYSSKFDSEDGYINIESSFDGRKNIFLDPVFKGGSIKCSFGEVILDLRKTTLAEGNNNLNVNVSFGSVRVIVPSSWNVKVQGDAVFGTFSDHKITHDYNNDDNKKLIISGKVAFGECEVRD